MQLFYLYFNPPPKHPRLSSLAASAAVTSVSVAASPWGCSRHTLFCKENFQLKIIALISTTSFCNYVRPASAVLVWLIVSRSGSRKPRNRAWAPGRRASALSGSSLAWARAMRAGQHHLSSFPEELHLERGRVLTEARRWRRKRPLGALWLAGFPVFAGTPGARGQVEGRRLSVWPVLGERDASGPLSGRPSL